MNEGEAFKTYVHRIRTRLLEHNKNWLAIICGETGSGKSYSALSIARLISKNVHIVFTPLEFLSLLNSKKISKGDVVVFDEAGVGMSSREWYSVQNKLLGSVLQTFRNMNVAVIFTTPNLSFIDVQARKLFHCYMETAYIDYDYDEAYLKVYDIEVNSRLDKIYYKKPKLYDNNTGGVYTMSNLVLSKAPENLLNYYEERKLKYTQQLNENALNELLNPKQKEKKKEINLDEIKSNILKNKDNYIKEYNQRRFIDPNQIRNEFKVSLTQAREIKSDVEKMI